MSTVTEHQLGVVRGDQLLHSHRDMDSDAAFAELTQQAVRAMADVLHFVASERPEVMLTQLAWEAAGVAMHELAEHESEVLR